MLSVMGNAVEAMEYLLEKGADPNARDYEGHSPYHFAVINADPVQCGILEKFGGDARYKNLTGKSAVELAFSMCNVPGYPQTLTSQVEEHMMTQKKYRKEVKRLGETKTKFLG